MKIDRLEQIRQAAEFYCNNDVKRELGFIEGAKWADSHSENIWHKVIDSPEEYSIILIEYQDIMAFDPFYDFVYIIDSQTFSDVVNEKDVLHWAYLDDVIKKLK